MLESQATVRKTQPPVVRDVANSMGASRTRDVKRLLSVCDKCNVLPVFKILPFAGSTAGLITPASWVK